MCIPGFLWTVSYILLLLIARVQERSLSEFRKEVLRFRVLVLFELQVIDLVQKEGLPMEERRISLTEFHTADEVCMRPQLD